jgi:hypothetical protein
MGRFHRATEYESRKMGAQALLPPKMLHNGTQR